MSQVCFHGLFELNHFFGVFPLYYAAYLAVNIVILSAVLEFEFECTLNV